MFKIFIERPVLSTVISIFFVVLGIIGIFNLPVEQYPDIAPPTIRVSAIYSGANADAVMNSVIIPLEEQINGVDGMTYITSEASNGGEGSITVNFKQGIDPDIAAVNVQNRVSQASSLLPAEVTREGVTVSKELSGMILMVRLESKNPNFDSVFIQNYAQINLVPQLKRINGVGGVDVMGAGDYSMRIWLKPDVMKAYKITATEVLSAIRDQNIDVASGELGVSGNQSFQFNLKYTGKLKTAKEFGDIIIRSENARTLRVRDVADVKLGSQSYNIFTKGNGSPAALFGIKQAAGSNARNVIRDIKAQMITASRSFPLGIVYGYEIDTSEFLNVSLKKLISTLFEVFILVFLIILVFLQNFRATLIPAIAVPVSIIGTFFFLLMFGFSINLLTLFALVLAIGMVVDDAIVVVEAIYTRIDAGEKNLKEAAVKTLDEITPAIISMTLVSCAVFLPVSFLGGSSGIFFNQFGLTLAVAIMISGVNALTLSPVLCSLFLKKHMQVKKRRWDFLFLPLNIFNRLFDFSAKIYEKVLKYLVKKNHRWISIAAVLAFSYIFYTIMNMLPTGFIPQEDSGGIMGSVTLMPGTSLEETDNVLTKMTGIVGDIPAIQSITSLTGQSFVSGMASSNGAVVIKLKPWDQRQMTADDVVKLLQQKTSSIKEGSFMFFGLPTIQGFGMSNGVEMKIQDRTGGDINRFYEVTSDFLDKLKKRPEIMAAMNSFDPRFPQKVIEADVFKIKEAGLTLSEVMESLQLNIGGYYVSNFNAYGKQYRVMIQASPEYRKNLENLNGIYLKASSGEMTPITEFVTVKDITGPQSLTRFNLYSSMDLTIIPNFQGGYTSGDIFKIINEIDLPEGYSYDYSGITREEVTSSSNTLIIFLLCVIFVYLLLAALYESYILPLAVIFSLPIGLSGVYMFVFGSMINGSGITNNIYVRISLVMIIGLLSRTAILIVEYALQRRRQGMSIPDAAISGAIARFRPVIMTSLTCIIGLLPLAFASGAGAIGNKSIGISALGGMLFGTFIGIFVIPVLFIFFQGIHEFFSKEKIITRDGSGN
jgi:hydrophobic/amphiphilic exporter-1 (mainly G- bacteria), HAE1 family